MCDLCKREVRKAEWFYITLCDTCEVPLIVSLEHKPEFSKEEKESIKRIFPNNKIQWEMRKIKDHAHCHIRS